MEGTFRYLWGSEAEARQYAEQERERTSQAVGTHTGPVLRVRRVVAAGDPWIFLRERMRGDDPDVTVRVFPNTTHEAFVVRRFHTAASQAEITRLAPQVFREIRTWISDRVATRDQRHFITGNAPMRFHHVGIPTMERFEGEIDLPHLQMTVSDHTRNPFGIQWQRYWEGAPYPELVKAVPHVAFEVEDLEQALRGHEVIIAPNSPSPGVLVAFIEVDGAPVELLQIEAEARPDC